MEFHAGDQWIITSHVRAIAVEASPTGVPLLADLARTRVRIVRPPDPLATPETVQHDRPAHNAHVRFVRALPSTSWGGLCTSDRDDVSAPRVHARDRGQQPSRPPALLVAYRSPHFRLRLARVVA